MSYGFTAHTQMQYLYIRKKSTAFHGPIKTTHIDSGHYVQTSYTEFRPNPTKARGKYGHNFIYSFTAQNFMKLNKHSTNLGHLLQKILSTLEEKHTKYEKNCIQALKSGVTFRYTDFNETLKCLTALRADLLNRLPPTSAPKYGKY